MGQYYDRLQKVANLNYDDSAEKDYHQLSINAIAEIDTLTTKYSNEPGLDGLTRKAALDWLQAARDRFSEQKRKLEVMSDRHDLARTAMTSARDSFHQLSPDLLTPSEKALGQSKNPVMIGGHKYTDPAAYVTALAQQREAQREAAAKQILDKMNTSTQSEAAQILRPVPSAPTAPTGGAAGVGHTSTPSGLGSASTGQGAAGGGSDWTPGSKFGPAGGEVVGPGTHGHTGTSVAHGGSVPVGTVLPFIPGGTTVGGHRTSVHSVTPPPGVIVGTKPASPFPGWTPPKTGPGSLTQPITDPQQLTSVALHQHPVNPVMTPDGPVGGYVPAPVTNVDDPRWAANYPIPGVSTSNADWGPAGLLTGAMGTGATALGNQRNKGILGAAGVGVAGVGAAGVVGLGGAVGRVPAGGIVGSGESVAVSGVGAGASSEALDAEAQAMATRGGILPSSALSAEEAQAARLGMQGVSGMQGVEGASGLQGASSLEADAATRGMSAEGLAAEGTAAEGLAGGSGLGSAGLGADGMAAEGLAAEGASAEGAALAGGMPMGGMGMMAGAGGMSGAPGGGAGGMAERETRYGASLEDAEAQVGLSDEEALAAEQAAAGRGIYGSAGMWDGIIGETTVGDTAAAEALGSGQALGAEQAVGADAVSSESLMAGQGAFGRGVTGAASEGLVADGLGAQGLAADGVAANGAALDGLAARGLAADGLAGEGLAVNGLAGDGLAGGSLAAEEGSGMGMMPMGAGLAPSGMDGAAGIGTQGAGGRYAQSLADARAEAGVADEMAAYEAATPGSATGAGALSEFGGLSEAGGMSEVASVSEAAAFSRVGALSEAGAASEVASVSGVGGFSGAGAMSEAGVMSEAGAASGAGALSEAGALESEQGAANGLFLPGSAAGGREERRDKAARVGYDVLRLEDDPAPVPAASTNGVGGSAEQLRPLRTVDDLDTW